MIRARRGSTAAALDFAGAMPSTLERVPPHLRQYVAQQDYAAYDEIDQAVWRFILIQTHARLRHTAHPAYAEGLARFAVRPRLSAIVIIHVDRERSSRSSDEASRVART